MPKTKISLWSWMLLTRFAGIAERKNSFRTRMMLQVELQQVLVTQKGLDTYFNDDAIVFGRNFSSHSSHLSFHDDSSMSTRSLLGRSFPYISMICWYESFPSGTFVIMVGIKNKSLEAECENLVNLNSFAY